MVIEGKMASVGPVVGDLRRRVVAHHLRTPPDPASRFDRRPAFLPAHEALPDEPVHFSAVYIGARVRHAMRATRVPVASEVVWPGAATPRFGHARRPLPVSLADPRRAREGPEVMIKRPVFLHNDDHVLDLVDAHRGRIGAGRFSRSTARVTGVTRWRAAPGQEPGDDHP